MIMSSFGFIGVPQVAITLKKICNSATTINSIDSWYKLSGIRVLKEYHLVWALRFDLFRIVLKSYCEFINWTEAVNWMCQAISSLTTPTRFRSGWDIGCCSVRCRFDTRTDNILHGLLISVPVLVWSVRMFKSLLTHDSGEKPRLSKKKNLTLSYLLSGDASVSSKLLTDFVALVLSFIQSVRYLKFCWGSLRAFVISLYLFLLTHPV